MRKVVALAVLLSSLVVGGPSASAISGTKCSKAGQTRTWRGKPFQCVRNGRRLVWQTTSKPVVTAPAAGSSQPCLTVNQINERLPVAVVEGEWSKVAEQLSPIASSADQSGLTQARLVTTNDPNTNNLVYGRFYPSTGPSVVPETQGGRCAHLSLILEVEVRFTGSQRTDEVAKQGIQAAVKALLAEALARFPAVNGLPVAVVLIEVSLQDCPGREVRLGDSLQCPWNDWGFLYFHSGSLTSAKVLSTPNHEVFNLGIPGAVFPPRPFTQIGVGGLPSGGLTTGNVRDLVPAVNSNSPLSTYVEFSGRTKELGQTIRVDKPLPVSAITVRTSQIILPSNGRPVAGLVGSVPATVRVRFWRSPLERPLPISIDTSDLTRFFEQTYVVSIPNNGRLVLPLPQGTTLPQGEYLVTFAIVSDSLGEGTFIRFGAFAQGANGESDVYAPGRAYRGCSLSWGAGARMRETPPVDVIQTEEPSTSCRFFYPEISKGGGIRPKQHPWVWSDLMLSLES